MRGLLFSLLVAGNGGCGHESGGRSNPGDLPLSTSTVEWRLPNEGSGYSIASIDGLVAFATGDLYILDRLSRQVFHFDSTGRFIDSFGGRGTGPGQFETPLTMGHLGDTLWVHDIRLGRFTLFSRAGSVVRTINAASPPGPAGRMVVTGLLESGKRLASFTVSRQDALDSAVSAVPVLGVDSLTGERTTFGMVPLPRMWRVVADGRALPGVAQPFVPSSFFNVARDGSYLVFVEQSPPENQSGEYVLRRVDSNGRTVFESTVQYSAMRLPSSLADSLMAVRLAAARRAAPGMPDHAARDSLLVPRYLFPVSEIVAGRDGTIWLRRESYLTLEAEAFNPSGERVQRVMLPRSVRLLEAERDRLWGVVTDSNDVAQLVRLRTIPPAAAADPRSDGH